MAAQAKPSTTCDSLPTAIGAAGSLRGRTSAAAAEAETAKSATLAPAFPSLPLGLYIHVPFCASTCDFCAFYQEKPRRQSIDLYLDAVAAELRQTREEIERGAVWLWQGEAAAAVTAPAAPVPSLGANGFTVFFGGGTPGLLPAKDLDRLCALVRQTLDGLGPVLEWTIELAPSTVKADKVRVLLDHGVNRFSLGVQSFSEPLLDALGRQHSPKQALAAYRTLRGNGAANINCDLMFALPGQSREAWLEDLAKMRALGPEHISTYCLTFEEDTALWVKLSQGRYKLDPEHEAALYRETWDWLAAAGYAQYEVSNFAREGFRSRHNLAIWQMSRWRGIGPSAASQWGGWRFQNPASIEGWAKIVLGSTAGTSATMVSISSNLAIDAANAASVTATPTPTDPADATLSAQATGLAGVSGPAAAARPVQGAAAVSGVSAVVADATAQWPPQQAEQREALGNRLLAADALIFGLRRRAGVNKRDWLMRFGAVAANTDMGIAAGVMNTAAVESLPLQALEALFSRLRTEGMLLAADDGAWRLSDEGMLLADAVGGEILECFA